MVEYTLICDRCGRIILASRISTADARRKAEEQGLFTRRGREDLCTDCLAR